MYFKKNELTLLYNGERSLDKKTLAMAMALSNRINRQDLKSVRLSETLFDLLLQRLNIEPKELFDKSNPYYQSSLRGTELDKWAWFQALIHQPELLKAPVALFNDKAVICHSPSDILKVN